MTYDYEAALARRVAQSGPVGMDGGSGYFAERGTNLDPALFENFDHLRADVRTYILNAYYHFMKDIARSPQMWSTLWIAGSGITTAWDADREAGGAPGDLDVLIGVDYDAFRRLNNGYVGSDDVAIAHEINQSMHDGLWPKTANTRINGSTYELTYYINTGVGDGDDDILIINPYAAYNITNNFWTQYPVDIPEGFSAAYFSAADRAQVVDDTIEAERIKDSFNRIQSLTNAAGKSGSPMHTNLLRYLHDTVREGAALYSEIHDQRHRAFDSGGKGYFDPANYRWQAGKLSGAVSSMRSLKKLDEDAHRDIGLTGNCANIQHLLLLSALANGGKK